MAEISVITQNTEVKPQDNQVLTKDEKDRFNFIMQRLVRARNVRDQRHVEFDDMTIQEWVDFNARTANSYLEPRKNRTDTKIVSGTPKTKMKAIISHLMKMELRAEVFTFDKNENECVELGRLFSGMIDKSNKIEHDNEKKRLRYEEMMTYGTVFIEEAWVPTRKVEKKITNRTKLDPTTGFEGLKWITKEQVEYNCEKRIYNMIEVFLGDFRQYELKKQPYLFTRHVMLYDEAEQIYGKWKNWKYVKEGSSKKLTEASGSDDGLAYRNWNLYDLDENTVEVIKYQDLPNNEYQIIINGVMMLPVGFPLPWGWDDYSLKKSVYDPVSSKCAYGKSLISEVRVDGEVYDTMLRMLINKANQSIKPPMSNNSNQNITPRIYDAGTIWEGINVNALQKIIDHNGPTPAEIQMFQIVKDNIDKKTVNPTFQGQQGKGTSTATEILEMQRQSQIMLGLILLSVQILEEGISELRLYNILENWTKPVDYEIDSTRKKLKNKFRKVNIKGTGMNGKDVTQIVEFTDEIPIQKEKRQKSYDMLTEEFKDETKSARIEISLPILNRLKYKFFINVNPSERESDSLNKVLFKEKMDQAITYFGQSVNMDHFKTKWALTWGENPKDAFAEMGINQMEEEMKNKGLQQGQMGPPDTKSIKEGSPVGNSIRRGVGPNNNQAQRV